MYLSNDETSFALHLFIHFIILRIKSKFSFESNTSRSQFPPCFRLIILTIIHQNQIKCACFKFSMENSPFDLFSNPSSNRWKGMERSMTRRNKRSGRGMKIRLKGRREKGLYFCFRLDDKIKATFDRDSKSSRNVPQLCYALTIGIFFFFPLPNSCARCPVTAAFSIAQISRGNTGGQRRDVKLGQGNDPRRARVFYDTYQFSISNSIR